MSVDKPQEDLFFSKNMFIGETRRKGIKVTKVGGVLNITIANVTVYNADNDQAIQATANCTIDNITGNVYAYIAAGDSIGSRYAIFYYVDGLHKGKARLDYEVTR